MDERALDLAVVDCRVDAPADIHFQVCAQTGPISSQGVDFHFCGRDALGEVVEHLAGVGTPDVADVGGTVEALGGEVDAIEVCGVDEIFHGSVGAEFFAVRGQAGVELGAGVEDGVAVEIAGGGGGGGGGVGDGGGGGFGDEDLREGDMKRFGGNHGHFGVEALAHFATSVGEQDGSIVVDVDEGACLIEVQGGKGDAELGGDNGEAAFAPFVGFVEGGDC